MTSGMMKLGEDLEEEILVRLPAKSLMRFKCVQRSWNALFKTPAFVARHMHMLSNNRCLMTILHHNFREPPYITLLSSSDSDDPTPTHIPFTSLFPNPDNNNKFPTIIRIVLYGNCNGVFCLHENFRNHLILWNPTTREVHAIPPPLFPFRHNLCGDHTVMFGFGNGDHPNNNTANDLRVVHLLVDNRMNAPSMAQIYSLSTKSWILIDGPAFPVFPPHRFFAVRVRRSLSKYSTLVNGVYHWITGYSFDAVEGNILCFDFRSNRFSKLRPPVTSVAVVCVGWEDIAEINGSLAYVVEYTPHHHDGPERMGIWVMDQQGWARKYSIGPIGPWVHIRGMWKDGAQVLGGEIGQPLTSYDHDGKSVHQFQIKVSCNDHDGNSVRQFKIKVPSNHEFDLLVREYVPSIVPLSM